MGSVDLHVHSTASDGELPPVEVVERASSAGVTVLSITDHDTISGVPTAAEAGGELGVRVVSGCEFSVRAGWGELHLLAYFLPLDSADLEFFLSDQRQKRERRAEEIVRCLRDAGVTVSLEDVRRHAQGGVFGRPHVARALVELGVVADVQEAFDRYLGAGRRCCVPKVLPTVEEVVQLVRASGGVTSAAHLKHRATRNAVDELKTSGVDALEAIHPSHDESTGRRIRNLAGAAGLLLSGGTDWHGDDHVAAGRGQLGSAAVPIEWFEELEALSGSRTFGR
ncbi:MAG: PHP domain-containing protein [Gemmatimonadales bacterium]